MGDGCLENHYNHYRLSQICIIFSPKVEKVFAELNTDCNRSNLRNKLQLTWHLVFWSRDDLELKFNCAQIWGGGAKRLKSQKSIFLSQSIGNIIYSKISSLGQLEKKYGGFPSFWSQKKTVSYPSPRRIKLKSWNLVSGFSKGHKYAFWGFRLFTFITPTYIPEMWIFGRVFSSFRVYSSHNSPPNWTRKLKFSLYIKKKS